VLVAAFLNPLLLTQLRLVLRDEGDALQAVSGWVELEEVVRRNPVDAAVVDPGVDGPIRQGEVQRLVEAFPTLPVVLYTQMTPSNFRPLVEVARMAGVRHLVLHRFEDEPGRFRALLRRAVGTGLSDRMLEELRPRLELLPAVLSRAVERMFRNPLAFRGVRDLAVSAGMPARTVYRHLRGAGFVSPMLLVKSARLLRAFNYLRDPGHTVEDVAAKLRYSSSRKLAQHSAELLGTTPRRVRHRMEAEDVITRLVQRVAQPLEPGPRGMEPDGGSDSGADRR
jgi:AraC-like DNA-binding protein